MSALGHAASARRRHLLDDCDGRQVLSSPTSAVERIRSGLSRSLVEARKQPATILLIGVLGLNVLVGRHAQLHDRVHSHSSTQTRDDVAPARAVYARSLNDCPTTHAVAPSGRVPDAINGGSECQFGIGGCETL